MNTHPVMIAAPARLHLGFVDLNGGMGRRFGSLGLTLNDIETRILAKRSKDITASGIDADRASKIASRLVEGLGLHKGVSIEVKSAIPSHAGLGSGTQMALAVGRAISHLFQLDLSVRRIAELLDRGARSGIGIAAFEKGGFIVDGGRRPGGNLPAVISRLEFPQHWRVLLIFDDSERGLNGNAERDAFKRLSSFPEHKAERLCRVLTMQLLPGLAEQRLDEFGQAVMEIQAEVGDYFAPAQGGRFASPAVAEALAWLVKNNYSGIGQSSWGPTGFVVLEGETEAFRLSKILQKEFSALPLRFQVVAGKNSGAMFCEQNILEIADSEKCASRA